MRGRRWRALRAFQLLSLAADCQRLTRNSGSSGDGKGLVVHTRCIPARSCSLRAGVLCVRACVCVLVFLPRSARRGAPGSAGDSAGSAWAGGLFDPRKQASKKPFLAGRDLRGQKRALYKGAPNPCKLRAFVILARDRASSRHLKMKQSKLEMIWESAVVLFAVAALTAVVAVWVNDNARQALRWERVEAARESALEKRAEAISALVEGRAK